MEINEAWVFGRKRLAQASLSPDLDSRLLLQFVLKADHSYLIAHGEETLTPDQDKEYRELVYRALQKEPIPYLTGSAPFYGLEFQVSPDVLIPRPETEQLVELALSWAKDREALEIVDVGTGSGCIAVALAKYLPGANITAVDISKKALIIARKNADHYVPGRIKFLRGNLLSPRLLPADLIIANLPYITDEEWTQVDDGVKWYEPTLALRGGVEGLDFISELLQQAAPILRVPGAIFLEIGWQQGRAVERLAKKHFPFAAIEVLTDFAGHERIISICTG